MKALRWELGQRQAPQLDGALQAQATFLLAVLLDQLLDALELSRRIRRRTNHPASVWQTSSRCCPLLHTAERLRQRYWLESMRPVIDSSADADVHKGAIEYDDPCDTSNAPGLDDDGLPNDDVAIAEDAIGAREDGSQG